MPDVISCEASAMITEGSEANRVLKNYGYMAFKRFEICVFWVSPKILSGVR